jgi:hypothetical protein
MFRLDARLFLLIKSCSYYRTQHDVRAHPLRLQASQQLGVFGERVALV